MYGLKSASSACPALPGAFRLAGLLACASLLAACSTSPVSGRTQFNILPGPLESTVSDLRFGVKTLLATDGPYCADGADDCQSARDAAQLAQRLSPIAERLGTVAPMLSPELVARVPRVEVFVVASEAPSVTSSAGGKIAVSSALARLNLSDTDLAFALAREFARLAAAHHRESTSAGIAISLVTSSPLVGAYVATSIITDLLFPMGTLLKLGISILGSMGTEQLVEASQQEEADTFAGKLMLAAGYDLSQLAEARPGWPESALKLGWLPAYISSRTRVAGMAPHAPEAVETLAAQDRPAPPSNPETAAPPLSD